MQREKIHEILKIKESYQLADTLLNKLLSSEKNEIFDRFMTVGENLDHDWFTEYFQQEQGDRNNLKQDFTPDSLCLIAANISGQEGKIGDICSGTGGLTLKQWQQGARDFFCLEYSTRAIAILLFNLSIRNVKATVIQADALTQEVQNIYLLDPTERYSEITISDDKTLINQELDNCVMNPPYSLKWDSDKSRRFEERFKGYELAPKSKADYAFVLDGLHRLKPGGTLVAILPHEVLFRGSAEEKIRKQLIDNNLIDMIIGVPDKLFLNTGIPVCLLVLKKNRKNKDVLFIDALKEFEKVGAYNILTEEHIENILSTIRMRRNIDKYAEVHSVETIKENDYNLNIPRYVSDYEPPVLEETFEEAFAGLLEISKEEIETEKELLEMMKDLVASDPEDKKKLENSVNHLEEVIKNDETKLQQLSLYAPS